MCTDVSEGSAYLILSWIVYLSTSVSSQEGQYVYTGLYYAIFHRAAQVVYTTLTPANFESH